MGVVLLVLHHIWYSDRRYHAGKNPCWQPHPIANLVEPDPPSVFRYLVFCLLVLATGYTGNYYYPNGWTGEQPAFWDIFMLIPLVCLLISFFISDNRYSNAKIRNELLIEQNQRDFQVWQDWAQQGWVIRDACVMLPESIELEARVSGLEDIESRYGQALLFGDESSRHASRYFKAFFKHYVEIIYPQLQRKQNVTNDSFINPSSRNSLAITPITINIILPSEYQKHRQRIEDELRGLYCSHVEHQVVTNTKTNAKFTNHFNVSVFFGTLSDWMDEQMNVKKNSAVKQEQTHQLLYLVNAQFDAIYDYDLPPSTQFATACWLERNLQPSKQSLLPITTVYQAHVIRKHSLDDDLSRYFSLRANREALDLIWFTERSVYAELPQILSYHHEMQPMIRFDQIKIVEEAVGKIPPSLQGWLSLMLMIKGNEFKPANQLIIDKHPEGFVFIEISQTA